MNMDKLRPSWCSKKCLAFIKQEDAGKGLCDLGRVTVNDSINRYVNITVLIVRIYHHAINLLPTCKILYSQTSMQAMPHPVYFFVIFV